MEAKVTRLGISVVETKDFTFVIDNKDVESESKMITRSQTKKLQSNNDKVWFANTFLRVKTTE